MGFDDRETSTSFVSAASSSHVAMARSRNGDGVIKEAVVALYGADRVEQSRLRISFRRPRFPLSDIYENLRDGSSCQGK